jgi:hypothetical protein
MTDGFAIEREVILFNNASVSGAKLDKRVALETAQS